MSLWDALSHSLRSLLNTHPLAVIAAILFFEELGVPSPLPGDVMMMLAGVRAAQGSHPLWAALLVQELATVAGATGLFLFSRRFGRSLVARYGWVLHLGPETLARAEATITKSGGRAIALGRIVPGLRIVTPIAAGVLGTPLRAFLPAVSVGAFLYILFFTLVGYIVGPTALTLLERLALPTGALVSLAVVGAFFYLLRRIKRGLPAFTRGGRGSAVAARLDGLIAGVAALLLTDGIVGIAIFLLRLVGYRVPIVATETGTALRLVLGWPVFLLLASILGAVDERLGAERLPRLARVAVMAGVPLAVTLLVAIPLAQRSLVRLTVGAGGYLIAIEVVRWLAFGLALSELLPLDAELHQVTPAAEADAGAMGHSGDGDARDAAGQPAGHARQ
jgi:membrane protein DedA with SNARE-associated domain